MAVDASGVIIHFNFAPMHGIFFFSYFALAHILLGKTENGGKERKNEIYAK